MFNRCGSIAVALVLAITGVVSLPTAAHAETPVTVTAPPDSYSPQSGVIFNNPMGPTSVEQQAIITHLNRTINSVPSGSKIRIAVYSFFFDDVADNLIAAKDRGVEVKMVIDGTAKSPQIDRLKSALGTNTTKSSYIKACKFSCMSSTQSYMHAKLYMFSRAGSSKLISMIGSSNIALSATYRSWNNIVTMENENTMYNANLRYFNDLTKDKTVKNYYFTASSGIYKAYYYPRAWSKDGDTMLNILNGISCDASKPGSYGVGGKTVVRFAMFQWTYGRIALAKRAWELADQGCRVEVVYSGEAVEKKVTAQLLKRNRYGVIPIYNGRYDRNANGVLDTFMHHKVVMIDGTYLGNSRTRAVYTGSANFTNNAQRTSNEIMLRLGSTAYYNAFAENINMIRDNYTVPVTTTVGAMSSDSAAAKSRSSLPLDDQRPMDE